MNLTGHRCLSWPARAQQPRAQRAKKGGDRSRPSRRLEEAGVEIGARPIPGFDDHLLGVTPGTEKSFRVSFPADYGVESLAGRELDYAIEVTGIRRKHVPALDDEFAQDLGTTRWKSSGIGWART